MLRPLLLSCCFALLLASLARADDEPFTGFGPVPIRNYQPIQLIFLNLPVERARVLPPGAIEGHIETVEINEIATVFEPQIEGALKFETNRTVIGGKYGIRPGLEVGLDIPFLSHFGGFLDPVIDAFEAGFGTTNPERSLYPDNSFGAFFVRRPNVTLFQGYHQVFEIGDIWLSAKQEIWHAPAYPLISLRAAFKAPTGRAGGVFGSGHPDFGLGFAAEYQALTWLMLYGDLSGIFPTGTVTAARLTLNPIVNEAVAAEAQIFNDFSLLLQQEFYTSPIHGTGTRMLDGSVAELTLGANLRWGPVLFQFAVVDNIGPVLASADLSMLLRMSYQR